MDVALQLASNVAIPGALFALVAAGFSLIYAVSRTVHLAHGGVALLGGYVFWYAWSVLAIPPLAAAAAAIAAATLLGLLLHALVYERLRGRAAVSGAGMLVAALSVLLISQNALLAFFGAQTRSLAALQGPTVALGPVIVTRHEILLVALSLAAVAALAAWLRHSRTGTALRAVADHEAVAEVVGISSRRMRALAFGVGSALAGLGGILFAVEYGLEPGMSTGIAVRAFFRAITGGIGSVLGALVGSGLIETATALTAWFWNGAWTDAVSFLLAFLVLLARPRGLLGRTRRAL